MLRASRERAPGMAAVPAWTLCAGRAAQPRPGRRGGRDRGETGGAPVAGRGPHPACSPARPAGPRPVHLPGRADPEPDHVLGRVVVGGLVPGAFDAEAEVPSEGPANAGAPGAVPCVRERERGERRREAAPAEGPEPVACLRAETAGRREVVARRKAAGVVG